MQKPWVIRDVHPDDIPFIYSSWLKSYKHGSDFGKSMRSSVFFENYREILDYILNSMSSHILIACLPDEPNVIIGYLVGEYSNDITCIHYMFVKESFRRLGVASSLLGSYNSIISKETSNITYTHVTHMIHDLIPKYDVFTYNPIALYRKS